MQTNDRHKRASELFLQVVELPPEERLATLEKACKGDTALLTEVQSLLDHDIPEPELISIEGVQDIEEESLLGRTIGRYEIVDQLGHGGMGVVWKARDTVLGRFVALKFLPPSYARLAAARKRFLREARTAAELNHPNIATVYDTGEIDDRVFIAMECVDGKTVADRLWEGPMPADRAVAVAIDSAAALGYAHAQGVLHRDVGCKNIMLTDDGRVVIVDFGLALKEGVTRITQPGQKVGTVAYMAPELFHDRDATVQSDIYGLGVMLYYMLTGHLPFRSERPPDLVHIALHFDHEPPSALVPELPPEIDRIVARALAKDPADRYATAEEMATDLDALRRSDALPASAPAKESVRKPQPSLRPQSTSRARGEPAAPGEGVARSPDGDGVVMAGTEAGERRGQTGRRRSVRWMVVALVAFAALVAIVWYVRAR